MTAGAGLAARVGALTEATTTLFRHGVLAPSRPDRIIRRLDALRRWGPSLAGGFAVAAAHRPDAIAIIDECGEETFAELHRRTDRLAHAFTARARREGGRVGVLARKPPVARRNDGRRCERRR